MEDWYDKGEGSEHMKRQIAKEKAVPFPSIEEIEVRGYISEIAKLQIENKRLKEALKKHKHTDKCFEYAANTARRHGNYYCIAECADSRKQVLEGEE